MSPDRSEAESREMSAQGPRRAFAWARAHRAKLGLLAGACALGVAGVVGLWLLTAGPAYPDDATLDLAMQALDGGDYEQARQMAEALRDGRLSPNDPLGAPAFLLGAAAAYEAEDAWPADKEPLYLVAARYLEEARDLGFPPGRQGEGLYLLGRSLYLTGQMAASRLVLRQALEANPDERTEIHRLLAAAYLEDANPKLLEALEHNAICLADHTLPDEARHQGLIQRAEILLRLGKNADCLETLDQIPPEAERHVEAIVLRGRVLLHEARALNSAADGDADAAADADADAAADGDADAGAHAHDHATKADEPPAVADDRARNVPRAIRPPHDAHPRRDLVRQKYHEAIETLRLAQGRDTLAVRASRKAMYLIGLCYLELGDARAALTQFARTRRKYVDTPEATAAGFQIAELSRRLGRDQEALAAYREALSMIDDVRQYSNPWISLDELRARLLQAYEHYRDAERFEICLQLTRLLYPVFSRARSAELTADTYRLWGRSRLDRAGDLPLSRAEPLRREGRAQLRRAGRTFGRLAEYRVATRHHSDDLWDSAQCYLEGHGFQDAAEALQAYLKSRPGRGHPRALLNLGEALLAVGRIEEAIVALEECVEFHPRDAASFRARLVASRAYQEKGDLDKAQALLEKNLSGEFLTPDSREWRDSLFSLGELLHRTGRHDHAIPRLEEAVARYPDSPQTIEARYLIADSYRRRAQRTGAKLSEDLIESVRLALREQIAESLRAALGQYEQAREALGHREKTTELSREEASLLRNCSFSIAGVLFDLGRYEESIEAYTLTAGRYPNAPEVLEAYVRIARAYHQLDKPELARKTAEQAKVVLQRIGNEADFERTTIYGPDEWLRVLDSLASL
jgi:tetratricopeptide (TPR) repeat protein